MACCQCQLLPFLRLVPKSLHNHCSCSQWAGVWVAAGRSGAVMQQRSGCFQVPLRSGFGLNFFPWLPLHHNPLQPVDRHLPGPNLKKALEHRLTPVYFRPLTLKSLDRHRPPAFASGLDLDPCAIDFRQGPPLLLRLRFPCLASAPSMVAGPFAIDSSEVQLWSSSSD